VLLLRSAREARLDLDSGGIYFNASHSGNLVLLAFARRWEVRVDDKRLRSDLDIESISARCFTPPEAAALHSLPSPERRRASFGRWTRKEACVKVIGAGLSLPPDRFHVLAAGMPMARLLKSGEARSKPSAERLQELDPGPGYLVGALAAEERDWCSACWQ